MPISQLSWHGAVQRSDYENVRRLFHSAEKPNVNEMCPVSKNYAIEIAVRDTKDVRMVQTLLELGANPRYSRSGSLLQAAVTARQFDIAERLERYYSSSERVAIDYEN
jgi:hypothetical protein